MRTLSFSCLFVLLAVALTANAIDGHRENSEKVQAEDEAGDLGGIYSAYGTDGSQPYSGSVVVVKAGQGYLFLWTTVVYTENGVGTATNRGVGIRTGDTVSVSWSLDKTTGVTQYAVKGKSLEGAWISGGAFGKRCRETLRKVAELPPPGGIH